jgi:beta-lactam-binding protein with PASTA domain
MEGTGFIAKGMQLNIESIFVDDEVFDNTLLEDDTDTIPPGKVLKQIPPPFETIYSGQNIDIWLSTDTAQFELDTASVINEID